MPNRVIAAMVLIFDLIVVVTADVTLPTEPWLMNEAVVELCEA
jgi:hypothetical protein